MNAHTPGPWDVSPWGSDYLVSSAELYWIGVVSNFNKSTQNEANARLMSAAPDMLSALVGFLREFGDKTDNNANVRAARAAIAKAEGRA